MIPDCLIDYIVDGYKPYQIDAKQNFSEVLREINSGRCKQRCGNCKRLINNYITEISDEYNGHTLYFFADQEVFLLNCNYDFFATNNYDKIRLWCTNCLSSFYGVD
jgi:hypothetical protein